MKHLAITFFASCLLIGCGDEARTPDLSCNMTVPSDLGEAEMCIEMTCVGDQATCLLVAPTMTCEMLLTEGSEATVSTVTGCAGDPCHSRTQSAGDNISISSDYFALNDVGIVVCAAMNAE